MSPDGAIRRAERARAQIRRGSRADRAGALARGLGAPALFAIALSTVGSSIYFALGVVADDALGLTPLVVPRRGLFFVLTTLTYVEGSSLHPERGGASTFARYAFNELWSFVAGWAILLDYLIVMAIARVRDLGLPDGVLGRARRRAASSSRSRRWRIGCVARSNVRGLRRRPAAACVLRLGAGRHRRCCS